QHYSKHQNDLKQQSGALLNALHSIQPQAPLSGIELSETPITNIREQLAKNFDKDWGGFGSAPKFPHPSNLERLLRHWRKSANQSEPDVDALFMTALSISRMQNGGLYDQLGGGFYRYSVDQQWQIPHFEKMLYDNGPLLALTAQLWQASGDDAFRRAAAATADWVIRDMQSSEGGFYATLDADSEGEEGLFYLWTPDQLKGLLDTSEYTAAEHLYGLREAPNFEERWHLTNRMSLDDLMENSGYTKSKLQSLLDSAQQKMLDTRNNRIAPNRDEKILVAWNGLMIRGLAIASGALAKPELADAAALAVDFIRHNLLADEKLLACYANNQARFNAYLDDYAFLLDAIIELLQQRWDNDHLQFAIWLADQILERFEDKINGGFFFTANDHEKLLYRPKSFSDDSMPSGNAVAALALNRLGYLLGESRYIQAAERTLIAGWALMLEFPHGHAALITALDEHLSEHEIIIVRGNGDEPADWCTSIRQLFTPERLSFAIPADAEQLPESLALKATSDTTIAYVCRGNTCSEPVTSLQDLATAIAST
ncbi:MAG: thioredoxin domain-containing protein, partial [Gammaproteobacteria bacterium]|nr:thioredoxin domain-containing protein [Gammaproteobacteria bacterium]